MKRKISLLVSMILVLAILAGCGKPLDVEESTIYVKKNGKIEAATVERFDKDYYDAQELEQYVDEAAEKFNAANGEDSVVKDKFSVEDGIAKLNITYASSENYEDFNNVKLFAGTLPEAELAGYQFDEEFLAVSNGVLGDKVDRDQVLSDANYKVIITNEKINIRVDGTVQYVSEKYTGLESKNTVSVKLPEDAQDGEELALVYVIYK